MNIYDKAYELADAIKDSGEWKEIQAAKAVLQNDKNAEKMYIEFRTKQMQLQQMQMAGQQISDEDKSTLQKQFEIILMNNDVKKLIDAENKFGVILEDVQKILFEAMSVQ
ncbi:YlbF family regulator [Clostridium sp. 'deep sea']|uniref:YlbF family regulator n=1 Tax=Clostridium sp. 'deep sea' TaxID=2779445 RepID=UPI0018969B9B|nr:YlbF family regulator [Clostridium sp. 'deep sea']QOR35666.1 YlbF family regulator [Clostridium sp. 'deep sea']